MPSARTLLVPVLLVSLGLAGCLSDDSSSAQSDDDATVQATGTQGIDPRVPQGLDDPRVVVAVIDTGINVYHDWFQREGGIGDDVVREFTNSRDGKVPIHIPLSQGGTYDERVEKDEQVWANLEPQTLYYFEGTNVLGISFSSSVPYVLDAPSSHGSGTSGAVLDANPNAIIVLVESFGGQAEAWVAEQDWIDIVSMSYGPPGSLPGGGTAFGLETHVHTKAMWNAGQIPVGAADNTPSLAINDETAGPPWVVGVAGDHESTKCRDHISGTFPDVTSNFTQTLPRHDNTSELRTMSGTSFATPKTAGTFSRVLYEVRSQWGHTGGRTDDGALALGPDGQVLTNGGLRDVMNRTATYFDFTDCPVEPGTQLPVNPVAPWAQMGWGHIGHDSVQTAVDHILGVQPASEKPLEAQLFQEAMLQYRAATWSVQ